MKKGKSGKHGGDAKYEVPYCEDGQVYGRVLKMLGNGRLTAKCSDGKERACRIRGSMRKREWVRPGDTVLIALREFDADKADVIHRYQPADVQKMARYGEPVHIAADEDEAAMDDLISFAAEPDLPGPAAALGKPDEELDWDRI